MLAVEQETRSTTTLIRDRETPAALVPVREGKRRLHPVGVRASLKLRGQEYVVKRKWLSESDLTPDGGETDRFDDHATHYAVLDSEIDPQAKALATVRFIEPTAGPLPILELFPELGSMVDGAHEVSRYISLDEAATHAVRAVIIAHLLTNDVRGVAVIAPALVRLLARQSLVVNRLTKPRRVAKYGSERQVAVEIDAEASANAPANAKLVELAIAKDWAALMEAVTQ